ncbi:MAG TPA: DNA-directed RNA polymerase, partial [Bacillota bacterium]|nr:DNA-directed RNA polymerase [Bacillota bacterium]
LTKQHSNPTLRAAWKKELKEKYGIGYIWGTGGKNFHYHYSAVRIGMLNSGELLPETEPDSLSSKLMALNEHLESHQFQMTVTNLERLERMEEGKRTHFYHLVSVFFNVGGVAFEKLLADYLASYDKTPYETGFKKYLNHLTFRPILKLLALKMSVVIRNEKGTKWPAFLHDLFYAVAMLNQTAYKKYISIPPQDVEKETVFKLGLMFFSMFEVTFQNFITFSVDSGYGNETGQNKQQLSCSLNPDNPLAASLGDRMYDLFHDFKYPMVIPPKKWKLGDPFSGGFQTNGSKIKIPLCHSRDAEFIPSQMYLDGFNAVTARSFTLNYQFIEFCRNSTLPVSPDQVIYAREFIRSVQKQLKTENKQQIFTAFVTGRVKPLAESQSLPTYSDYANASERIGQYHGEKIVYKGYEEIQRLAQSFLKNDYPGKEGLQVCFPGEVDYRGRIYPDTDLSYTTTKLSRYALQASLPQPFVFTEFKKYAVKVYLGSRNRKSPLEAEVYFDKFLHLRMTAFETEPAIYLESDDPYAMIACCLEYQRLRRYLRAINNDEIAFATYRSKFFISIDGTASGPQIIAGLLRNGLLARELNICPLHDNDKPGNVYLGTFERFLKFLEDHKGYLAEWEDLGFNNPARYKKSFRIGDTIDVVRVKVFYPIFKHLFMAGSYGLTKYTFRNKTFELLRAEGFDFTANFFVTDLIWDYVQNNTFLGDYMAFMEIVTDHIAKTKQSISYLTPLNVLCKLRHAEMEEIGEISFYRYSAKSVADMLEKTTKQKASTVLAETKGSLKKIPKSKQKHKVTISQPTGHLDFGAMAQSLAANVIHSCDASIVARCALEIDPHISFFPVHDCFYFTTDQVSKFYAVLQKIYYELFIARDYLRETFIPCMPAEIRPKLLAKLDEIQSKHPFDPSFLLSPSKAGNALYH